MTIPLNRPPIRLLIVVLTIGLSAGCNCGPAGSMAGVRQCCVPGLGSGCFGYYSTCWNAWPSDCPVCPTFTAPGTSVESLPPAAAPAAAAPPVPEYPAPPPSPPMGNLAPPHVDHPML